MDNNVSFTLRIKGRVQGVAFRWYTMKKAVALGLKGYVKNMVDGSVEVIIEGEKDSALAMIDWCKIGPPAAIVEKVDITENKYEGNFRDFDIKYL